MRTLPDQTVTVRVVRAEDAAELARLLAANNAHLAPVEAERPEAFATEAGQAAEVERSLDRYALGASYPGVIELDGRLVGRINLSHIVLGSLRSADLGYWVDHRVTGRGVARLAVRDVLVLAFGPLGLHRVQAATLVDNQASQRVLDLNGFERIGLARHYLRVAGRWQDHVLFQRIAHDDPLRR